MPGSGTIGTDDQLRRPDRPAAALSTAELRTALPRVAVDVDAIVPKVRPIVDDIAERGAPAALEYGEKFDGVRPETVRSRPLLWRPPL